MKTLILATALVLLAVIAPNAFACSGTPFVPPNATTADAISVALRDYNGYFSSGGATVSGTDINVFVDIPGIPPPPGPTPCRDLTTHVGYLPAGAYTVRWFGVALPAAQKLSPSNTGTAHPSATPPYPPITSAPLVVTQAVPAIDARGLLLLGVCLALAALFAIR